MTGSSRLRGAALPLLAAAVVAALYLPALDMGLFGDDFEWLDESFQALHDPARLFDRIVSFFRPVVKLSYLADWLLFGPSPLAFNLTTLGIHLVNVLLLWALVVRSPGGGRWLALASALLWGASSLYSEVTLWAAGRPDSLLAGFMLGALVVAAGADPARRHWRWIVLALACGAAGSKETWVVLPPLLSGQLLLIRRWPWRRVVTATAGVWLLLAAYLAASLVVPLVTGASSPTGYYSALEPGFLVAKTAYVLASYAGLGAGFTGEPWEAAAVAAGLAAMTVGAVALRDRLALWALGWMLLTMLPSVPVEYTPSRYNYLPLIGFWVATAALSKAVADRVRDRVTVSTGALGAVASAAVLAVVVVHGARLQLEIRDYRRLAAAHSELVALAAPVLPLLDGRRPVVLVDQGRRRPIAEVDAALEGRPKLMFVRRDGLWQLIRLAPLVNVLGDPGLRMLVRAPAADLPEILGDDPLVLLFTDHGFALAGPGAAARLADLTAGEGRPPPGVSGYRWRWGR